LRKCCWRIRKGVAYSACGGIISQPIVIARDEWRLMLLPDNDVDIIGGTAGQARQEFPQTLPRDFTLTIIPA
jgi:hypothetical protein